MTRPASAGLRSVGDSSNTDQLIVRATFWPRLIMGVGSFAFLVVGAGVWWLTGEFSGFSLFSIAISTVILVSIIRSLGLVLVVTPHSVSQRGLLTHWEVTAHDLTSWALVRNTFDRGYETIVVRSEHGEKRLSTWIVTGNRRYHLVLDLLRRHHGSKEVGRDPTVVRAGRPSG